MNANSTRFGGVLFASSCEVCLFVAWQFKFNARLTAPRNMNLEAIRAKKYVGANILPKKALWRVVRTKSFSLMPNMLPWAHWWAQKKGPQNWCRERLVKAGQKSWVQWSFSTCGKANVPRPTLVSLGVVNIPSIRYTILHAIQTISDFRRHLQHTKAATSCSRSLSVVFVPKPLPP